MPVPGEVSGSPQRDECVDVVEAERSSGRRFGAFRREWSSEAAHHNVKVPCTRFCSAKIITM